VPSAASLVIIGAVSRRARIALMGVAVLLFAGVSTALARWLSLENAERDAVLAVLRAQARGDATAMLARLHGCGTMPSCVAAVRADAQRLRGGGEVKILAYDSTTAYAFTSKTGKTRVAWKLPGRLPDVQCVLVQRSGNAVTGLSVTLRALSEPIPLQSDC
jgi:hypothetical protein